jgi:lipopolysaccharide biosynthesis glycosyltransferase
VDRDFVVPLAAALTSLDRALGNDRATAHVLHSGVSTATRERVTTSLSVLTVVWHEISDSTVHSAHYSVFLSPASLYRLLLADVLPDGLDLVLYLDADTVVVASPRDVFDVDLRGHTVGAVRDASSPWAAGPLGPPWRSLGMDPSSAYFNSGALLIDLGRWREQRVKERSLEVLRGSKPRWGDQDALNAVLENDWTELPRRWNLQTPDVLGDGIAWAVWRDDVEQALECPAVIHYTGRDKPWHHAPAHPMSDRWFQALDGTSWAGWRPPRSAEPRAVMVGARVARAARDWSVKRHKSRAQWT